MDPKIILKSLETKAKKSFGQNFLTNEAVIDRMLEVANIQPGEAIVEVGPGLGVLTEKLIKVSNKVIAVELDRDLAGYLRDKNMPNLTVVTGSILDVDWTADINGDYSIVSNIPYQITSPLLRKIFAVSKKPRTVVLLIQKEVAERICAKAGSSERGFLTLLTEANARAEIIMKVAPENFYPSPKVDSAVIQIETIDSRMDEICWPAVEGAFQHKRQTLINGLVRSLPIKRESYEKMFTELKLNLMARPSDLSFDDWAKLSALIWKELK